MVRKRAAAVGVRAELGKEGTQHEAIQGTLEIEAFQQEENLQIR